MFLTRAVKSRWQFARTFVGLTTRMNSSFDHVNKMAAPETINVPSENKLGACPAFVYGDPSSKSPGLIVIQEWWGVNDSIKEVAKCLHEQFKMVTLIPDLYRGKVAIDRETAGHLVHNLNWKGAGQDIDACARHLKSMGCPKVGATGFCVGGALSLMTVAMYPSINAVSSFYGIPTSIDCDMGNIKVPVQCHFGAKDNKVGFSSPADYKALGQKFDSGKVNYQFYEYDADHSFCNPEAAGYSKEARDLSFSRMQEFFTMHLAGSAKM